MTFKSTYHQFVLSQYKPAMEPGACRILLHQESTCPGPSSVRAMSAEAHGEKNESQHYPNKNWHIHYMVHWMWNAWGT